MRLAEGGEGTPEDEASSGRPHAPHLQPPRAPIKHRRADPVQSDGCAVKLNQVQVPRDSRSWQAACRGALCHAGASRPPHCNR